MAGKVLQQCPGTNSWLSCGDDAGLPRDTEDLGEWEEPRSHQAVAGCDLIDEELRQSFRQHSQIQTDIPKVEKAIRQGKQLPTRAARSLLGVWFSSKTLAK